MEESRKFAPERRRCLRQMVHAPAFASFDGVTGGMILDLSEEGLSLQMGGPFDVWGLDRGRQVRLELELPEPDLDSSEPYQTDPPTQDTPAKLETTGNIARAAALGRAGVGFWDVPEGARRRLKEWLMVNAGAPSHTAPKVALGWARGAAAAA